MQEKPNSSIPLLTIAIPTYNRAVYLEKSLSLLSSQFERGSIPIEILVSDNQSSDNTREVVEKAVSRGLPVRYICNATNIGAERNVVQCFEQAGGHFVLVLGDDDYIVPGALPLIYDLLNQHQDLAICYLANSWSDDVLSLNPSQVTEISTTWQYDPMTFIQKVNYWVTFLSGNIINKSLASSLGIDANKYIGTGLPQLGWYFPALFNRHKYLIINTTSVICQSNNTAGYDLVEVFGRNFNAIMDDFDNKYYPRFKQVINWHLLNYFFPLFINNKVLNKNKQHFLWSLFKLYWSNPSFWRKGFLLRVFA